MACIAQLIIVNLVDGRIEVYEDPNVAEGCYGVPVVDWLPEVCSGSDARPV
jgi:hypothetical protein